MGGTIYDTLYTLMYANFLIYTVRTNLTFYRFCTTFLKILYNFTFPFSNLSECKHVFASCLEVKKLIWDVKKPGSYTARMDYYGIEIFIRSDIPIFFFLGSTYIFHMYLRTCRLGTITWGHRNISFVRSRTRDT